jgi:hypothetical protein
MLRRIFEVTGCGEARNLCNKELHNLYLSSDSIGMTNQAGLDGWDM